MLSVVLVLLLELSDEFVLLLSVLLVLSDFDTETVLLVLLLSVLLLLSVVLVLLLELSDAFVLLLELSLFETETVLPLATLLPLGPVDDELLLADWPASPEVTVGLAAHAAELRPRARAMADAKILVFISSSWIKHELFV